jgi:predicted FMN-binding regulatory protein PaiB
MCVPAFKMNQNKAPADIQGALDNLKGTGSPPDRATADFMQNL